MSSCDLVNADGQTVEVDARNNPGALAGRFTCFRTFANGPEGVFIAQDLTRAGDGSVLQYVHIRQVADIACNVVQAATENLIGETPLLNEDGTATAAELSRLAEGVNSSLEQELLKDKGEGQRASSVLWEPNADDDLSAPGATLTGVLTLITRGTIVNVATSVKIPNA